MLKNNLLSVINVLKQKNYHIKSVFDIGANQGKWTSQYDKVLPDAKFFLFEANPNRKKPKIAKNHVWISAVLSSPETEKVMFYDRMGTGDSYYKEDTTAYDGVLPFEIKTTTVDNIVDNMNISPPQLVKLDTQGSEIDILKGMKKTLDTVDIVQIETPILAYNKGAPGFLDYISYMMNHGFLPIGVEGIQIPDNILMQMDIIFVRTEIREKYYNGTDFWKGRG